MDLVSIINNLVETIDTIPKQDLFLYGAAITLTLPSMIYAWSIRKRYKNMLKGYGSISASH